MGRNLIKKKRRGEVYYNFKGLANGVECPIVGRPTRNHRTWVRMVEYLVRDARIKKEGWKRGSGKRIARSEEKDKRGRLRNDSYFRSARHVDDSFGDPECFSFFFHPFLFIWLLIRRETPLFIERGKTPRADIRNEIALFIINGQVSVLSAL